jgi:hypothetical protein
VPGGAQRLDAKVDEVSGAGELDRGVGGRGRDEERREAGGERSAVNEQPGEISEDRPLRECRPSDEDLASDERHVGARDHGHEDRGHDERE